MSFIESIKEDPTEFTKKYLEQNGIKATNYHLYENDLYDLDKICIQSS
jgi:hypothetical protein